MPGYIEATPEENKIVGNLGVAHIAMFKGDKGEEGGYYTPAVDRVNDDILEFSFTPSKPHMPTIKPIRISVPGGNIEVDATLSKNGKAADAKAVGDALSSKMSILVDRTTGVRYTLYVDNGKLMMEEGSGDDQFIIPGSGVNLKLDETLKLSEDGTLSVNTTDVMESDNTLPITSAGVHVAVGGVEMLLQTI